MTVDQTHPGRSSPLAAGLARLCCRRAWVVAIVGVLLGVAAAFFAVSRFSMDTNTFALISPSLSWRVRENTFNRLFRPEGDQTIVVIDGATPELAEAAARRLAADLSTRRDLFRTVDRPDGGPFFSREGLLFESPSAVRADLDQLVKAQPFLGSLAADPSLRGLMATLSAAAAGASSGQASLADLAAPMSRLSSTLERIRAGQTAFFSWRALVAGGTLDKRELRRVIAVSPVLNYRRLKPGAAPDGFIRAEARRLGLDPEHGVRVRLTGDVPLADVQLSSLSKGAGLIAAIAFVAIVAMLWLAVRSARLIQAILATMLIGLACAAAVGLLIYGRFNVISVAFIPLFVGLGIDFGIQYSVRFLACRSETASNAEALEAAGATMGRSLTLAATAIAVGFFAFAPTRYVGVSQLGVIAGVGMFIALALNLTLLPALIAIIRPPVRGRLLPGASLEALDRFILARRRSVLGVAGAAALVSAALILLLHFDFNPLHLQDAHAEAVSTLLDLSRDPAFSPNTAEVIAPSLAAADQLASRLSRLAETSQTRTASDFVPADQPEKLAAIASAASLLDLTLNPIAIAPPPTDAEVVASLRQTASDLNAAAAAGGPGAAQARRLAGELAALAAGPVAERVRAHQALIEPFEILLDQTRAALSAGPVTLASLPHSITRDWLAPDGQARVSVTPAGDSNTNAVLRRFIAAVRTVAPDATGPAVANFEGGRTVAYAFLEAGVLSFIAITLLLFAVLRRARDVVITLTPIVLTGLLTLGSCVLIHQPINFANIIALPLLFGIGVAFHIYFVLAWRHGGGHLLASSLTRAVFFSALATATGFGSLWASSHPGTASMGKLLMISLIWTLASALLFQPALMGPPRERPTPSG
ncbi:MAG TPA: MMPL family transporter [Caulobacteraceae bacterium]|nr:MMPL family transporter [Caulobacteraceae bacterium]